MYFQRFYDDDLAQASYLVGCQQTGGCLVVDPVRGIDCVFTYSSRLYIRSEFCQAIPE
ncbi:hypothetical protein [Deinococcus planocerae]|uniref:hypothetical protein n=1 Tax=Deinococcus planocerae TaxID=1737569 RepID=UPI0015E0B93D|nr:hypothetical protein [Deinococcus planocerae]